LTERSQTKWVEIDLGRVRYGAVGTTVVTRLDAIMDGSTVPDVTSQVLLTAKSVMAVVFTMVQNYVSDARARVGFYVGGAKAQVKLNVEDATARGFVTLTN